MREFRVRFRQARVFLARDLLDAVRQAEATGAGEIVAVRLLQPAEAYAEADRAQRVALADRELDDVRERLGDELRNTRPELFDERGRLRKARVAHMAVQRTGGRALSAQRLRAND